MSAAEDVYLKPCPFCGGPAKFTPVGERDGNIVSMWVGCADIHCIGHDLKPPSTYRIDPRTARAVRVRNVSTEEAAAEHWNRRAES